MFKKKWNNKDINEKASTVCVAGMMLGVALIGIAQLFR